MKYLLLLVTMVLCWSDVLVIDIPVQDFEIYDNTLKVADAAFINQPGEPNLPCKVATIGLPLGAVVKSVTFHATRKDYCTMTVPAAQPPSPLTANGTDAKISTWFTQRYADVYSSSHEYPQVYGHVLSRGSLRRYSLVTVACYHFSYKPLSRTLCFSPHVTVEIHYEIPSLENPRLPHWESLKHDITFDGIARELLINWTDVQTWYRTATPRRANGYYIILPSAIQSSVDTLAAWRQAQGYDVHVVTKEYIEANIPGNDTQQKFRNYLRQHMADIAYALLVGFSTDMPWRNLVPFNNDPDSPWNNWDYSPIPSDLYLAELTDPDSLSWNSDGDAYYGEVFDENFQPVGEDDPDYHADIHLGRIPFSTPSTIEDICQKLISFDYNTDITYKTASLLTGALYYYANENNSGNARMDGADFCEQLLIDSILPRSTSVTLYEKGGLRPCTLSCTDSLNHSNHIAYWQNKGVMYECHHGNVTLYARKLWAWDDGDSIPETPEIEWPTSLYYTDVYQLDNVHPATCFLRSCLCGKPEETGLGAMLLYRGGSDVISSSRVSWSSAVDRHGIPHHFYKRLLQDTLLSNGIIGNAYDVARNDFMDATGFWLPAYHYNLFGDPALRQYGMLVGSQEHNFSQPVLPVAIFPNPTSGRITLQWSSSTPSDVELDIYDECGRCVYQLHKDNVTDARQVLDVALPAGVYFVRVIGADISAFQKLVILR